MRTGEEMADFQPLTERVKERNKIALKAISGQGIAVNDLFTPTALHPGYYTGDDGTHLSQEGVNALAIQVTAMIERTIAN